MHFVVRLYLHNSWRKFIVPALFEIRRHQNIVGHRHYNSKQCNNWNNSEAIIQINRLTNQVADSSFTLHHCCVSSVCRVSPIREIFNMARDLVLF